MLLLVLALGLDGMRPGAGGIQMLRDRLMASSGGPGSSHGPVLATSHFPLEAAGEGSANPARTSKVGIEPKTGLFTRKKMIIIKSFEKADSFCKFSFI